MRNLPILAAYLLAAYVTMSQPKPITIRVHSMPTGVPFAYDETGAVEFGGDFDFDPRPSKIHHLIAGCGSRWFVFQFETEPPRERVLVRADHKDHASTIFALWCGTNDKSVRMDALSVFEVYE